jgi:AcrR family transcriptional regulator
VSTDSATEAGQRQSARERLLQTADRLFYAEGVQTVGIDRIIEEAGVAKASLYRTFGSKDALIDAYLRRRHDGTLSRLSDAIAGTDDPREKVLRVFDVQARTFAEPTFNGCAFMEASAEAEPGGTIDRAATEFRGWIRNMFVDLATELGVADPDTLGRQLHVLYDGGIIAARMDHDPTVAADSRAAASALIDAAGVG